MDKQPQFIEQVMDPSSDLFDPVMTKWIKEFNYSRVQHLINQEADPAGYIYQFVRENPTHAFLDKMEQGDSPTIIANSEYLELVNEAKQKKMDELNKTINFIVDKLKPTENVIVHYMTYYKHFHQLFIEGPSDDDRLKNWIRTVGLSNKVNIVDDDGKVLFVHPGVHSEIPFSDNDTNVWNNFSYIGAINEKIKPDLKEAYQRDYVKKYVKHMENSVPDKDLLRIAQINRFFSMYDPNKSLSMNVRIFNNSMGKEKAKPKTVVKRKTAIRRRR